MKKATIYVNHFYVQDRIFLDDDSFLNRDDQLEPFRKLRTRMHERGYSLRTQDFHPPEESELVLYIDVPKRLPSAKYEAKSYLVLLEPELIIPANYNRRTHKRFRKVFTWLEDLVESDSRYVKIRVPQIPPPISRVAPFEEREKLCCMIAGGKLSLHPKELYSERIRWIRWFEKRHPADFDFYGAGWERMWMTGPLYIRAINKLPFWRKLFFSNFKNYRGKVDKKFETLSKYRFSICLENGQGFRGYITEKIFDCLFSGNVPLYHGAPDITHEVPKECFIDLREFKSKEEIYERISTMSAREFNAYQESARRFLSSPRFDAFSTDRFVDTLIKNCLN